MSNLACRIQYTSGLFVDMFEKTVGVHFVKPCAPILVLNGNIGYPGKAQTRDFLRHCSRNWDTVFYIPGAHELGTKGLDNVGFMRHNVGELGNVYVLHNEAMLHRKSDTLFLGTYDDEEWAHSWCKQISPADSYSAKVAVLSHKPPTNYEQITRVSTWIYGSHIGGKQTVYKNGLLTAYNGRGRIDGKNDFTGEKGWSRSACLNVTNLV
jgi:hypothetical protein